MIGLIDHQGENRNVDDGQHQKQDNGPPMHLFAEIDDQKHPAETVPEPAFSPHIKREGNEDQTEHCSCRKDQEGHNGGIVVLDQAGHVTDKAEDKQGETDCRQADSEQTDRRPPRQPEMFLPGEMFFHLCLLNLIVLFR